MPHFGQPSPAANVLSRGGILVFLTAVSTRLAQQKRKFVFDNWYTRPADESTAERIAVLVAEYTPS
jgi:hypothetical protein